MSDDTLVDGRSTGATIPVLPGSTANALARRGLGAGVIALMLGALAVILNSLARVLPSWVQYLSWVVAVLLVGALTVVVAFSLSARRKDREEVANGYTTAMSAHNEVPQVLSQTGTIIRLPGQPYLTGTEYRAAIHRARRNGEP